MTGKRTALITGANKGIGLETPAFANTGIKVNAADPGYTATDFNGNRGTQTVDEGARASVKLALLDDDGPTGGFFDARGRLPW